MKREPLIKFDVELERMEATLKDEMNHPEIAKIGLGNVDTARLETRDRYSGRSAEPAAHAEGGRNLYPRIPATARRTAEDAVLRHEASLRRSTPERACGLSLQGKSRNDGSTWTWSSKAGSR